MEIALRNTLMRSLSDCMVYLALKVIARKEVIGTGINEFDEMMYSCNVVISWENVLYVKRKLRY